MKLKPKHIERLEREEVADSRRYAFGRKKHMHLAATAALTFFALVFAQDWEVARYTKTGQLPRPGVTSISSFVANKPKTEQPVNRASELKLTFTDPIPLKQSTKPVYVVPEPLKPPRESNTWVRNDQRYLNRQAKLKHFIDTGEWKDFVRPTTEKHLRRLEAMIAAKAAQKLRKETKA